MALSNDLISQFVKVTQSKEETNKETTAYGKIIKQGDVEYVQLDGSDLLTPISSTTVVKDGDRVMVTIKDHTAIVTGDFTNPAANSTDVVEIGNKITDFEIVIADKVNTEQLEAEIARIEKLQTDNFEAVNAEIETLTGKVAKIDKIEADQIEVNGLIEAHEAEFTTLRADIADFKDVTAESVKAVEGKFNTLEADYTSFEETTTNKLTAYEADIKDLTANSLTTDKADLRYANIDFSNIQEAAIEKLFSDSGIIEDLIMSEGKVTGKLVGVTITGDLIEGNTVKADKLVVLGEDGLYYKLNVNSLGEATASSDEKYQNGLDGSVIIANSITAEHIAVDDLVAFGATIGGFHINDHAIYSGAKVSVDSNNEGIFIGDDGQINIGDTNQYLKYFKDASGNYKLEILADSLKFGANKTTIEEYIESKTENISTIKETEGSELYIDDGQKIIEFRVDGKSEQETRSGKNIYNYTKVLTDHNGLVSTLNDDGSITTIGIPTTNYTVICTETITDKLEDGETYVISVKQPNSKLIFQLVTKEIATQTSTYLNTSIVSSRSFTVDKSKYTYGLTIITTTVTNWGADSLTINNTYQLEKGSTATTFEKYGATPSPDFSSEIISLGYENLFKPTLTADDGSIITVAFATVELEDDVYIFTCKNGTDMYFGQVGKEGNSYNGTLGYLIDVSGIDSLYYNVSNDLFKKNFVSYFDENKTCLKVTQYSNYEGILNLKNAPTGTKYITFRFGIAAATIGEVYRTKVHLVKSDKKVSYVPYGKYGIEIINEGKNVLDLEKKPYRESSSTLNGATISINNGVLTVDATKATGAVTVRSLWMEHTHLSTIILKKGTYYTDLRLNVTNSETLSAVQKGPGKFTIECDHYLTQWFFPAPAGSISTCLLQIERSDVKTEYEPYRCNSAVLILDQPLRGFQNGVKDVAYIKQGKLYIDRKIGSITLKGGETIFGYSAVQGDYFLAQARYTEALPIANTRYMMSNYFKFLPNWGDSQSLESIFHGGSDAQSFQFKIKSSRLESVNLAGFGKWLSAHPTHIIYELNTPITEEIGLLDIDMIDNAVNNYYINDNLEPNLYCKYYKSGVLIDNTIYDELQNINSNLINNYYTKIETDAQLKIATDSISASVSEIKTTQENTNNTLESLSGDIVELTQTVSAKMSSEDVTIAIQKEMANGVSHVTTSTGFTFNEEGLTVSKTGKEMSTTIDEDGMTIKRNEEERLIANNEGVIAYDLHARTYLIVGANSRFEDYEKDGKKQTGCFWIGDTEV